MMPVPLAALRPLEANSAAYVWAHELGYMDISSIRG